MILNKEKVKELILKKGLIQDFINLESQLTPNGFDLTVGEISKFKEKGALDFSNKERKVPKSELIFPVKKSQEDKFGWFSLHEGVYKIKTNEVFSLPSNIIAFAFSRSSLLRAGAFVHCGIWDAGFSGRAEFLLSVLNRHGFLLKENARIVQVMFAKIKRTESYGGIFKNLK